MRPRLVVVPLLLMASAVLSGCGSGGGTSTTPAVVQTANVNVTVNWAARTRSLDGPSSAQSLVITLKNAAVAGGDFAFTVNRESDPAAYKKKYTSPQLAKVGAWDITARFHAQPGGAGAVVGAIDAQINLAADGSGIGDFATTGTIATVEVVAGQTLPIGTATDIGFVVKDSAGAILAITPGSAKFTVTSGPDKLQINTQGQGVGQAAGTAKVMVSVDGKASVEQDVAVNYVISISISPEIVTMYTNGQQTFVATVTDAPTLGSPPADFSILEGSVGGSGGETYTAPNTSGTYHVVATSRFDATKRAVATINVTGPASPNLPGIYVFNYGSNTILHMENLSGAGWGAIKAVSEAFTIGPDGKIYYGQGGRITRIDDLSGRNAVSLGSVGGGIGQLSNVQGIAIGPDGKIYIADQGNRRIVRIDDMQGTNWISWKSSANLALPQSLFISADNRIYFTDGGGVGRIDDMLGTGYKRISGPGRGLFIDTNDRIYTTWTAGVIRYDDMDGSGRLQFGTLPGNGTGRFRDPEAIWVTSNGQIHIADTGNNRIVRVDDMTGANWTTLGTLGKANNQFDKPRGIIVK